MHVVVIMFVSDVVVCITITLCRWVIGLVRYVVFKFLRGLFIGYKFWFLVCILLSVWLLWVV